MPPPMPNFNINLSSFCHCIGCVRCFFSQPTAHYQHSSGFFFCYLFLSHQSRHLSFICIDICSSYQLIINEIVEYRGTTLKPLLLNSVHQDHIQETSDTKTGGNLQLTPTHTPKLIMNTNHHQNYVHIFQRKYGISARGYLSTYLSWVGVMTVFFPVAKELYSTKCHH